MLFSYVILIGKRNSDRLYELPGMFYEQILNGCLTNCFASIDDDTFLYILMLLLPCTTFLSVLTQKSTWQSGAHFFTARHNLEIQAVMACGRSPSEAAGTVYRDTFCRSCGNFPNTPKAVLRASLRYLLI